MKTITFWQYFKLNKQTTLSCLKICSVLFAGIATVISLVVKNSDGLEEDPFMVFIMCELFGYGFATFIFFLAIIEGFVKAKVVIGNYNQISERVQEDYSIKLIQRPLNPKFWFMQFQIVQLKDGDYYELDERTKKGGIGIVDFLICLHRSSTRFISTLV